MESRVQEINSDAMKRGDDTFVLKATNYKYLIRMAQVAEKVEKAYAKGWSGQYDPLNFADEVKIILEEK